MSRAFLEAVFGVQFTDERPLNLDSHNHFVSHDTHEARVSHLDFDFEPLVEGNVLFYKQSMRNIRRVGSLTYGDRCDWWVVEYPEGLLQFRLCSAMKGSGYPAFAVARFVPSALTDYNAHKERLIEQAECLSRTE